jgi:dolichyl-diphosphooligosaccharide--protein glycosyltransferase
MLRNIKSAGGGFHGLRRGIKFLHIFGILFIAFLVVLPSTFVAFDAAVPNAFTQNRTSVLKIDMFGEEHEGAFGLGVGKEGYWVDAFDWLSEQDTDIEDPTLRPAFISWWDYGFYESAIGDHPTVADNFQDGIPPAANFHTATSEREAVAIFSIRLMEGNEYFSGNKLSDDVKEVLVKYVGFSNAEKIESWLVNPRSSPSYGNPIGEEYDEETSQDYSVGQQYPQNAVYHDITDLLLNNLSIDTETNKTEGLSDEKLTWLYHDLQEATGFSIRYYGVEGYDKQIFNIFGFLSDKSLLLVNGIADDYIELIYKGYTVDQNGNKREDKTWTAPEIMGMSDEERRFVVVTNTEQKYKDLYFETMFYRVYVGPSKGESGSKQEYDWQIPCLNMKHFYAEFISDLSEYPYYGTGKSAVVIAKYYEGAILNGTVTFLGEPVDAQIAVMKNLTYYEDFSIPIDHDTDDTDGTGAFNLIAGAGDVFLQIRTALGEGAFILTNVTFSNMNDSNFAPITEEDAMRMSGSNYERDLNITINPAELSGYVYEDIDDNRIFNGSIDDSLSDKTVTLYKITAIYQEEDRIELDTNNPIFVNTDENGKYQLTDILPGIYRLVVTSGDFNLHLADVTLNEGNNTYNAPNAKLAALDGIIFIDEDGNDQYDSGEALGNVDVELFHQNQFGALESVGSYRTDNSGKYEFKSLIPGKIDDLDLNQYILRAVKAPDYEAEITVYPVANDTITVNLSIGLSPVTINGIVTYDGKPVEGATIDFILDENVENNTAEDNSVETEADGTYEIELSPGRYNISILKSEENIPVFILTDQKLKLNIGQGTGVQNYQLEKVSVTLSGITSYGGNAVNNVTLKFEPEADISAAFASTISDEIGKYSVELSPGNYTVDGNSDPFTEDGKNYTYRYTGQVEIKEENIISGQTFDFVMRKQEFE